MGTPLDLVLVLRRVYAVTETQLIQHLNRSLTGSRGNAPTRPGRSYQLKGLARSIHFSRSRSLGFSGVPGWMIFAVQRSAA